MSKECRLSPQATVEERTSTSPDIQLDQDMRLWPSSPRVLFLGTKGVYSRAVLESLLADKVNVCGVLLPAPVPSGPERTVTILPITPEPSALQDNDGFALPVMNPYVERNIIHLAWAQRIPLYEVGRLNADPAHKVICSLAPDVACIACFPRRIPLKLLAIPPHGFLNVHPSLLPRYRGPSPLFWVFRDGAQAATGVTIHWLDAGLDTGDIAAQTQLSLPDGISGTQADIVCGRAGGQLLVSVLRKVTIGTASRRPQPEAGTYQPAPQTGDFTLEIEWTARRAFNFMRGTVEWGQPYRVRVGAKWLTVREALAVDEEAELGEGYRRGDGFVDVQFARGVLRAR